MICFGGTAMQKWLNDFTDRIKAEFKSRVAFIGIQGSVARGEATEQSDIDVVVILDEFSYSDLKKYDLLISDMDSRDKICGFISGKEELEKWDKSDLFQFYNDTVPLFGNLDMLKPLIRREDVLRAVHSGACNIYHMCVHNAVHEKSSDVLKSLYKSAVFILQAKHFYEAEEYIRTKIDLYQKLIGADQSILEGALHGDCSVNFDSLSEQLMLWAGDIIKSFK